MIFTRTPFGEDEIVCRNLDSWDRSWLVPFLLLSMQERDLYGSELMQKIADLGFEGVRSGEVFRALRGIEAEGLILSERGELDYLLSRRRYGLTESGQAYLEFLANSLQQYNEEIERFFLAYEGSSLHDEAYG